MGVIAEGILTGCQGLFTPVSLGYPLSVFNKNSTLKKCVCSSSPFLDPWGASRSGCLSYCRGVFRTFSRSGCLSYFCPALKGVDSRTQEIVSKWIQLLHKHPAHLHALDMKDAQKQRDPGIKPLAGITTSKLADKYIIKRNKIRNQITLLRGHVETGVVFFLDKV